jgi:protein-disulfide isomerase
LAQDVSQRNREEKRSARERLREQRERERAAERRKRQLKVAAAAAGVLVVVGAISLIATRGGDPDDAPAAEPVVVGDAGAPVTMAVYEDFRCPACGQFETTFSDTIHELAEAGKLRVNYHLVTIIDGNMGGNGSTYAANAALCARDAGKFPEYHDVLFENQPAETDDAFADKSRLIDLAGDVEGLDTETFRSCVQDGGHDDWVTGSNEGFLNSEYNATPTVLLNGEDVYGDTSDPLTPDRLRERVEELA